MSRLKVDELAKEISNFVNNSSPNEVEQLIELTNKSCTDARNAQSKINVLEMIVGQSKSEDEDIIAKTMKFMIKYQKIHK